MVPVEHVGAEVGGHDAAEEPDTGVPGDEGRDREHIAAELRAEVPAPPPGAVERDGAGRVAAAGGAGGGAELLGEHAAGAAAGRDTAGGGERERVAVAEARGGVRGGVQLVEGDNEGAGADAGAVGAVDIPDCAEAGEGRRRMSQECGSMVVSKW